MKKHYLEKRAEAQGYESKSYMAGFYDALAVDDNDNGIFDSLVNIKPLSYNCDKCEGRITGIFLGRSYGIEYKVRYYIDGKQYENYFYSDEIEILK